MKASDALLTKQEKNAVFITLQSNGFDPADFSWQEIKSREWGGLSWQDFIVSQLVHHATGYYFTFGSQVLTTCPGNLRKVEEERHNDDGKIKLSKYEAWLQRLKHEVEAPDLWATIGQEKVLMAVAVSPTLNNSPFTPDEQTLVSAKLEEIKRYLIDVQQFDAEQAVFIEREFTYLTESSQRLGRKDWLNALLGGLLGLAFALVLDPEKARGLLALAGTAFQSLWGVAQPFLQ
jgi:hypothetical protein